MEIHPALTYIRLLASLTARAPLTARIVRLCNGDEKCCTFVRLNSFGHLSNMFPLYNLCDHVNRDPQHERTLERAIEGGPANGPWS